MPIGTILRDKHGVPNVRLGPGEFLNSGGGEVQLLKISEPDEEGPELIDHLSRILRISIIEGS